MTTAQLFAGDRRVARHPEPDGSARGQAIVGICRLTAADAAALLAFHPPSDTLTVIAATPGGGVFTDQLPARLTVEAALAAHDARPRWTPVGEGEVLLLRAAEHGSSVIFVALHYRDALPMVRARVARVAADLVPLLGYHVRVDARLRELEECCAAATEALDQEECGVIALREDRSVVFANKAAAAHLGEGAGLRIRRGLVGAAHRGDAIRFEAALDAVIEPAKPDGARRPRAAVMLLADGGAARPTVVAITAAARRTAAAVRAKGAAAIVHVLHPDGGSHRGLDTLCRLHGLSRVEGRLLACLTRGATLAEAASDMRIKTETARAYLKQVFAKTGVHRQTELVSLMSRYLRALRGEFEFEPA